MAGAGLGDDLLLANEVVDATRLGELARRGARVTVAVDSEVTVDAAARAGVPEVLIDVNVGLPRCGCRPEDAGRLADRARAAGLSVRGVMGYEGHIVGLEDRATRERDARGLHGPAARGARSGRRGGDLGRRHRDVRHQRLGHGDPGRVVRPDGHRIRQARSAVRAGTRRVGHGHLGLAGLVRGGLRPQGPGHGPRQPIGRGRRGVVLLGRAPGLRPRRSPCASATASASSRRTSIPPWPTTTISSSSTETRCSTVGPSTYAAGEEPSPVCGEAGLSGGTPVGLAPTRRSAWQRPRSRSGRPRPAATVRAARCRGSSSTRSRASSRTWWSNPNTGADWAGWSRSTWCTRDRTASSFGCTLEQFDALPHAEENDFLPGGSGYADYEAHELYYWPYFGIEGGPDPLVANASAIVTHDTLPPGEVGVRRGERVHASDGEIGRVEGLVVEPGQRARDPRPAPGGPSLGTQGRRHPDRRRRTHGRRHHRGHDEARDRRPPGARPLEVRALTSRTNRGPAEQPGGSLRPFPLPSRLGRTWGRPG